MRLTSRVEKLERDTNPDVLTVFLTRFSEDGTEPGRVVLPGGAVLLREESESADDFECRAEAAARKANPGAAVLVVSIE